MKKIFFMGVMGMFLLGSCSSNSGHSHEGHNHDHEGHNHATEEQAHNHEGHSHEHDHEGHNHEAGEHNHEGHTHEATDAHAGHNHAATDAHSNEEHSHDHGSNPDEIILAPEKAKAAGVMSEIIQPKAFRQVIKASGEVQAAQGNESTIVANVSGVVSFQQIGRAHV